MQGKRVLNGTRHVCDNRNVLFGDSMGAGKVLSVEESSDGLPSPVLGEYFPVPLSGGQRKGWDCTRPV